MQEGGPTFQSLQRYPRGTIMYLQKLSTIVDAVSKIFCYIGAAWIFLLMFLISGDVFCRVLLDSPLRGIPEISMNSVASIALLMLPWAVHEGTNVRSTIFLDKLSESKKSIVEFVSLSLGAILFLGVIVSGWKPMITAIRIFEYEGEGALRVPTYPVRVIIVTASFVAFLQCLRNIIMILKMWKLARQNNSDTSIRGGDLWIR
jgi:TRAP-type C4-dicarboxylate transport system permease small subunit